MASTTIPAVTAAPAPAGTPSSNSQTCNTPLDYAVVRQNNIAKITAHYQSLLNSYTKAYSEYATKKTEIGNLNTIAKCIEYEARAYTETRKSEVYDADGNFTGYHASNTYTISRKIDMCIHWTANPDDPTDAGQVSLTAD